MTLKGGTNYPRGGTKNQGGSCPLLLPPLGEGNVLNYYYRRRKTEARSGGGGGANVKRIGGASAATVRSSKSRFAIDICLAHMCKSY